MFRLHKGFSHFMLSGLQIGISHGGFSGNYANTVPSFRGHQQGRSKPGRNKSRTGVMKPRCRPTYTRNGKAAIQGKLLITNAQLQHNCSEATHSPVICPRNRRKSFLGLEGAARGAARCSKAGQQVATVQEG